MKLWNWIPMRFRWRGVAAAWAYDDLDAADKQRFEAYAARHGDVEAFAAGLRRLRATIPTESPSLNVDLAPILRQRLVNEGIPPVQRGYGWRIAAFAISGLVALLAFAMILTQEAQVAAPALSADRPVGAVSRIDRLLDEAREFEDRREYANAYRVYEQVLQEFPDNAKSQLAQMRLAAIAFDELHRFAEARSHYAAIVEKYGAMLTESERIAIAERRNVLEEESRVEFAGLDAYARARASGGDSFARLVEVITNHPGSLVASLAAESMGAMVQAESNASYVEAMETARDRCESTVAKLQFEYELGCAAMAGNPARARAHFERALGSDVPELARRAEAALASLASQ